MQCRNNNKGLGKAQEAEEEVITNKPTTTE